MLDYPDSGTQLDRNKADYVSVLKGLSKGFGAYPQGVYQQSGLRFGLRSFVPKISSEQINPNWDIAKPPIPKRSPTKQSSPPTLP